MVTVESEINLKIWWRGARCNIVLIGTFSLCHLKTLNFIHITDKLSFHLSVVVNMARFIWISTFVNTFCAILVLVTFVE